ncbi:ABC transporter substrate-binding protein [Oceanidesulfovibrio marinus]|nr:ABC transporter substrate-binding protein [Oceanidesulfovibrio marinus]
MKRIWIVGLMLLGVLLVAPQAMAEEPFKIGVVSPVSGNYGDHGALERAGMEMALKDLGGKILGRTVELEVLDSESNPDAAARRARSLIEKDQVKVLVGGVSSSVGMAVGAVAEERKVLYVCTNGNSDELTSAKANHYQFRVGASMAALGRAAATYATNNLGKKWFYLTHDYSWGHSGTRWARDVMEKTGATEVGEVKVPLGTRDFSSQLLQIRNSGAEVLMITCAGFDNVALLKQLAEYKIYDKMKVVYTLMEYVDMYPLDPDERQAYAAVEVSWNENPKMEAASKKFEKMFPDAAAPVMDNGNYNGYIAIMMINEAANKAGSLDDVEKLICAMEGLEITNNLRAQPSYVSPKTHQVLSTVDIVKANPEGKGLNIWDVQKAYHASEYDMTEEENPVDVSCGAQK